MLLLESFAVILAVAYLLLAARENILCWYCAFASSAIYSVIFWDVSLLMESLLNVFYLVMAVVGWYEWKRGGKEHSGVRIRMLAGWQHGVIIASLIFAALVNGYLLQMFTGASWPYLDSFTTWASVLTTFMIVWKVLENWLYWIVIDSISIYLYLDRTLYLTVILFGIYIVLAAYGYYSWRKHYLADSAQY